MPQRKTKRSDGRYEASVFLGRDESGKIKRKRFYGKSQREANAKKQAYIDGNTLSSDASKMTLKRWSKVWLESYATGGVRNKANNESIINRFIEYIGGGVALRDIKQATVQAYAKTQANFTKSHVDKVRRTLGNLFDSALKNEYIARSPCDGVIWDSVKTGSHETLDAYLIDLITKHWDIHSAGIWAMFMLYAGLRPSEAFALKRENITENSIIVTDGSHFEHNRLVIVNGKPKSEAGLREIPILPPLRPVIEALPAEGLVCVSSSGKPVTKAAVRANWASFCFRLENIYNGCKPMASPKERGYKASEWKSLPDILMYDLRHTFCSMLYDADVDVKTAQYLMGHSTLDMTLKIYTHLSEKKKERSYEKLFSYFQA